MDVLSFFKEDDSRDTKYISQLSTKPFKDSTDFNTAACWKGRSDEEDGIRRKSNQGSSSDANPIRPSWSCSPRAGWKLPPGLDCFVEWKPHPIVGKDEYDDEYGGCEERNHTGTFNLEGGSEGEDDDRIRSKVSYLFDSFIAVILNEYKNKVPIWIEKVLSTTSDEEGNVCTLLVQWYKTRSKSTWMTGEYYSSFQDGPLKKGHGKP